METKADWLRSEIEKLEGMKLYAETQTSSTDYGNIQNALLGQHVTSHNQALTSIITRYKEELKVLTGE